MSRALHELLFEELSLLFDPLREAGQADEANPTGDRLQALFLEIGWDVAAIPNLPFADVTATVRQFMAAYDALHSIVARPPRHVGDLADTLRAVNAVAASVRQISTLLDRPGVVPPLQFDRIGQDLVNYLTARYLFVEHPTLYALGELLTLIDYPDDPPNAVVVEPGTGKVLRDSDAFPMLRPERLSRLLTDPVALLKEHYVPGGRLPDDDAAGRLATVLFPRLDRLFASVGLVTLYGTEVTALREDPARLGVADTSMSVMAWLGTDEHGVDVTVGGVLSLSPETRGNLGLVVSPFGRLTLTTTVGEWSIKGHLGGSVAAFALGPAGFVLRAGPETSKVEAGLGVWKVPLLPGAPALLLGSTEGTRLEVGTLGVSAHADLAAAAQDFGVLFEASKAAIVVSGGDGDGFLQHVLPEDGLHIDFDLGLGWSKRRGLYFRGSAGLDATLPVQQSLLGVLTIDSVYLGLFVDQSRGVQAIAATTITLRLGPVTATVERFGVEALMAFPPRGGNLGVADLAVRFKPPSGAALAIRAPGVEGGGYLFFDPQKEQYAGIVQLSLAETIAVKGVGLLTTRMPDGSKGFSLLVIITAEGFSPIPLGFGFTLTGIGGLLGINRTTAVETLRRGLKNGTLESILFPADPVRDAPRVVSDAGAVFPPAPGRHVFGPMVKITWGAPTILTMTIGLVLEVPEPVRLLMLGRVVAMLPDEKNALIAVRMDSLGTIDFATGEIALDAVLYDSRIANFALTGEMALRASWGDTPSFLLAIGGWNPRFPAPPGFPALARVALALSGDDPNARLRMEAYLAITSNTVQFGARLDFYFAVPPFSLEGRLGFDTLLHFAPFGFVADLAALLALRQDTTLLTSVALTMSLSGPAPWHAWGTGQFVIAGVKQSFAFDARYGAGQEPALPAPVDVKALLVAALADTRNWSGELPAAERPIVTLRSGGAAALGLRVHPLAQVAVRERIAPLETKIARFGNAPVSGENQFTLTAVRSDTGAPLAAAQKLTDAFALGQFSDLSDDQKLALPAFTQQPAGVRLGSRDVAYGHEPALDVALTYETLLIAPERPAERLAPYVMPAAVLDAAITVGAAAQAARRAA